MYKNFRQLSEMEKPGIDYTIDLVDRGSTLAVLAIHGGRIEPGTSDIAKAIAGRDYSCYCFEGTKPEHNRKHLHIASTRFDEPGCMALIRRADTVVTVHGCRETSPGEGRIYAGGRDELLKNRVIGFLKTAGFDVEPDTTGHSGRSPRNICNMGRSGKGLQLEISGGLRSAMLQHTAPQGPCRTTEWFHRFVRAARDGLCCGTDRFEVIEMIKNSERHTP